MFWKYGILLSVAALGLFMLFLFEDGNPDVSRVELAAALVGLVMFAGGSLGCIALLGRTLRQQRVSWEERVHWELQRTEGRTSFVRKVTVATTLIGGTFVSALILNSAAGSDSYFGPLLGCLVILVTLAFSSYAVAGRLWEFSESRVKDRETATDRLLENEAFKEHEVPTAREQFPKSDLDRSTRR
jgi:hypothetical protein